MPFNARPQVKSAPLTSKTMSDIKDDPQRHSPDGGEGKKEEGTDSNHDFLAPEKKPAKTAADLQKLRLERLMKNPDKPVHIPDRPKERQFRAAPEFVRDVMGSSAGAGSGEFHVYRALRRREFSRQEYLHKQADKSDLDEEYHQKLEDNKKAAEERTAKKRAKRQRAKQKAKLKKMEKDKAEGKAKEEEEDSDEEEGQGEEEEEEPHFVIGGK